MAGDVTLDGAGIRALLKSQEFADAVNAAATTIAAQVEAQPTVVRHDVPVKVDEYTTDRRAAGVTIAHPAGLAMQAKHGAFTRAAAAAGYEVKAR